MIALYLGGNQIDIYPQDIQFSWDNLRFSGGFKDIFTTDMDIPTTNHNIQLLEASGLIDYDGQPLGGELQPATLSCNDDLFDVKIQVTELTDDKISICCYYETFPEIFNGKRILDYKKDDASSIYPWYYYSETHTVPFKSYDKGVASNTINNNYCMIHPSKKFNGIRSIINNATGYTLPILADSLYLVAQNKYVCPQREGQCVMFYNDDSEYCKMVGGQQICNDLEGWNGLTDVWDGNDIIKFNRSCHVKAKVRLYYKAQSSVLDRYFSLSKNGYIIHQITLPAQQGHNIINYIELSDIEFDMNDGDDFQIWCNCNNIEDHSNAIKFISGCIQFTITNYEITDSDYETELVYCKQVPYFYSYEHLGFENLKEVYLNGTQETIYVNTPYGQSYSYPHPVNITPPSDRISWIGYYTNVTRKTIAEIYYALALYSGKDIIRNRRTMTWTSNLNRSIVLDDAIITKKSPLCDALAKKTTIGYVSNPNPFTINIDNVWLEDEINYTCDIEQNAKGQYSKVTDNRGEVTYEFNQLEGICFLRYLSGTSYYLTPLPDFNTLGLENIHKSLECEVKTYNINAFNKDYVYIDGHKYMVLSGTKDLSTGEYNLTVLLTN